MIKGALFTIGILTTLGGFGMAALSFMGAAMSDNTQDDTVRTVSLPCAVGGCVGIAMIVGACFL